MRDVFFEGCKPHKVQHEKVIPDISARIILPSDSAQICSQSDFSNQIKPDLWTRRAVCPVRSDFMCFRHPGGGLLTTEGLTKWCSITLQLKHAEKYTFTESSETLRPLHRSHTVQFRSWNGMKTEIEWNKRIEETKAIDVQIFKSRRRRSYSWCWSDTDG